MSTHPNGGLDLAVNYPNIWCFVQQTYKIGVMCNTSTKSRWFVQFPRVKSILLWRINPIECTWPDLREGAVRLCAEVLAVTSMQWSAKNLYAADCFQKNRSPKILSPSSSSIACMILDIPIYMCPLYKRGRLLPSAWVLKSCSGACHTYVLGQVWGAVICQVLPPARFDSRFAYYFNHPQGQTKKETLSKI